MTHIRRTFPHVLRLLALTALLGTSTAQADEYSDITQLLRAGKPAEALTKADQRLGAKPRDPQLRFLRGVALTDSGNPTEAIATFTKLTEDHPELPEPYNNLAVLYAGQNQFDKARAALEMAIRTNPSYATAHENLGDVYARQASMAYNKALQLDANQAASVQPKLGMIRDLFSPTTSKGATKVAAASVPASSPAPALSPVPAVAAKPASTPASALVPTPVVKPATTPASVPASAPVPVVKPVAPVVPASAPASTPTPAAKPASAPAPVVATPAPAADKIDKAAVQEVTTAVEAWAVAWSSKDLEGYLGAYGKDFTPGGKQSRKTWEDERRARVLGKAHISVKIEDLRVSIHGNKATARFRQHYNAGTLKTSSRKTLEMGKNQGRWTILREAVGD